MSLSYQMLTAQMESIKKDAQLKQKGISKFEWLRERKKNG